MASLLKSFSLRNQKFWCFPQNNSCAVKFLPKFKAVCPGSLLPPLLPPPLPQQAARQTLHHPGGSEAGAADVPGPTETRTDFVQGPAALTKLLIKN